jgi:Rps23 Pro-64 3,4-dihydroxylase Tpa1-like proline 4-hydroxylase
MINTDNLAAGLRHFRNSAPFDHCVIDEFFETDAAHALSQEFPPYHSDDWFVYNNQIEHKKALNNWEKFPKATYQAFTLLQSPVLTDALADALGEKIYVDHGLNGGGWHIHGTGGNLNPHLDYSIHPKMDLERVLNIIVYLSPELRVEHGGHLGLWAHDEQKKAPGKLVKEVEPRFNRAILFNTTQNSWHGMSRKLSVPDGIYRKSLAIYYMRQPAAGADKRGRALFAPREEQEGDEAVLETIRLRSNVTTSSNVYRT